MSTRGWENATPQDVRDRRVRPVKRSKYGATPTTVDGIRFDSAKEARRYGELKCLEKAGKIRTLTLQPEFPLHAQSPRSVFMPRAIGKYVADFSYIEDRETGGLLVVEDVKGVRTPLYKWKKKHVEAQYGIQIREV